MNTYISCGDRACARLRHLSHPLLLLACVVILLAWSSGVFAHAALVASSPAAGAVLDEAPASFLLDFNEPVSPLQLRIVQPDGSMTPLDDVRSLNQGLEISLPPLVQQGAHALSWRVVSADGHPVGGTVTFSVGIEGADQTAMIPQADSARTVLVWIARVAGYVGLFFGIGLVACHALLWPTDRKRRRRVVVLLVLSAVATLLNVGMLGVDALDLPISGLLSRAPWQAAWATSFGLSAALMLASLASAVLCLSVSSVRGRRLAAVSSLALVGAALAASGHASSAPPAWLARPAVWLHGVAIALWMGSLLPLAWSLKEPGNTAPLRRFSSIAPTVLVVLLLSGGGLVYLQLDTVASLWRTGYGRVLLCKLILVIGLMGLGAYNRYRLTTAAAHGVGTARLAMRRVIFLECLLAVTLLGVVALWRFTPPPRAMIVEPSTPVFINAHIHAESAMADLALESQRDGEPATLTLYLSKPDLTPLAAQAVDVAFFNRDAGVEPIRLSAHPVPDGTWQVSDIALPPLDRWQLRIEVLISDFERIRLETTLDAKH